MTFKYVLYEITEDFDIIIKLSFENHTYLNAFIEQHTFEKKYVPRFLILEFDANGDIDFIIQMHGTETQSRKCVAELLD